VEGGWAKADTPVMQLWVGAMKGDVGHDAFATVYLPAPQM